MDTDLGAIYRSSKFFIAVLDSFSITLGSKVWFWFGFDGVDLEGLEPRDIVRKIREMESSSLVLGYEEAAEIQRTRQLKVFLNSAPLPENSSSNHALPSHAKDSPKSQEH